MAGLTPDPRVAGLDSRQPEFSKPVSDYLKGVVTADRIAIGQRRRRRHRRFAESSSASACPAQILMGVWAMESGFGAIQGDLDIVRSLATLAAAGRRELFGTRAGDVVVNARPSASDATFDELAQEYRSLLAKSLGGSAEIQRSP